MKSPTSASTSPSSNPAAVIHETPRLPDPPLRLALGSGTHNAVHTALGERLAALEAQKDLAASVAFTE